MVDAEVLGKHAQDQDRDNRSLAEMGTIHSYFAFGAYKLKVKSTQVKVEEKTIGTAFIMDHGSNGVLDTSALDAGTMSSWSAVETINVEQNLTTIGKTELARWLNSNTDASSPDNASAPGYIAVGTSNTAFTEDDVALAAEDTSIDDVRYSTSLDATTDKVAKISAWVGSTFVPSSTIKEIGLVADAGITFTVDTTKGGESQNLILGTSS